MDRKSIAIIAVCVLLLFAWGPIVNKIYPPVPVPPSASKVVPGGTNQVAAGTNQAVAQSGGTNPASAAFTATQDFVASKEVPEELLVVTNENARYIFTSRGGGLKEVQLVQYPETIVAYHQKTPSTNNLATLNAETGPPIFAVLGDRSWQDDGIFKLSPTRGGVRAEKALANGLNLTKDFEIGTNYLVGVSLQLENTSNKPLAVPGRELMIGTATPMGPQDNGMALAVMWYNGSKSISTPVSWFNTNTTMLLVIPRTPTTEYREGSNNVVWASVQNQFFSLATMPLKRRHRS